MTSLTGMMSLTMVIIMGITMMSLTRMGLVNSRQCPGVVLNVVVLKVAVVNAGLGQAQVFVPIMWIVMVALLTPEACGQRGS